MGDQIDVIFRMLLPLLVFVAVLGMGGAFLAAHANRRRPIERRLRQTDHDKLDPINEKQKTQEEAAEKSPFYNALYSIGHAVSPKGPSKGLRDDLAKAGWYSRSAPYVFLGVKMLGFLGGLLLALTTIPAISALPNYFKIILVVLAAMVGMLLPNIFLSVRINSRQLNVRRHLPDAIDLMEICVSAGMGLDMAWRSVTEQIRRVSTTLADEMSLTDLEINLGGQRSTAMRHMAERTGAPELSWLVSAFVQSERFGTNLSDTLRSFAASLRETRSQRAEEAAEKMAVKILVPLILFIFPTIIIVTAGPAGIKIAELLLE